MFRNFKIELIITTLIVIVSWASYVVTIKNQEIKKQTSAKQMEIFDSTIVEVNQSGVSSILQSSYSVKEYDETRLTDVLFIGHGAKELTAKHGRMIYNRYYLDENVTLVEDNGYVYQGEHAIYDKNIHFFYITSPFVGYIKDSVIKGEDMIYDMTNKIVTADKIDSVFYKLEN